MTEGAFHVVTDGGCDIPKEMNISPHVVPLALSFGNEHHPSTALTPAAFYSKLASSPHHPTTSQPAPADFVKQYQNLTDKPILSLHISSGLSGTMNAADQASKTVARAQVHLHDTKTLSIGQAFQVYAAVTAAQRGESLELALDWVREVQNATQLLFTIDTLEYLQKGGRIGRVQAMLGSVLNLKPVVQVTKDTGTYVNVGRARSFTKAMEALVKKVQEQIPASTPLRVAIAYGDDQVYAERLLAMLREHYPLHWVGTVPVGPVLAVHTGPKLVGLCVAAGPWPWEKQR